MNLQMIIGKGRIRYLGLLACLLLIPTLASMIGSRQEVTLAEADLPVRRVNIPYLGEGPPAELFEPAIFWFGKVDPTSNYADVRMWYYDKYMKLMVNIIDRRVWTDKTPTTETLDDFDAVSIYFNRDGISGQVPSSNSYLFVAQLGASKDNKACQSAYRGDGSSWIPASISFSADGIWRGSGLNNDTNDKGWQLTVILPFDSLGLLEPPPTGTVWGLGVAVHDRDDASGTPIPDQIWPQQMDPNKPATWGQLHFGRAKYDRSNAFPQGMTTIQGGFNGAVVPDAHVGGNFTCGDGIDHWSEWGEANYAGSTQINIQNQWDIADYPCFSKYFVTFPLDSVPPGKVIVSARLRMNRFGNAGGGQWGEPPDSYIHALTVGEGWNEATINWNNAPLALENISGTWVKPVQTSSQTQYSWDVTKAVVEALEKGEPLRLALYSIDGERHSGKYFTSSDWNGWGARPRLEVTWGTPCGIQGVECHYNYIPMVVE